MAKKLLKPLRCSDGSVNIAEWVNGRLGVVVKRVLRMTAKEFDGLLADWHAGRDQKG